MIKKTCSFKHIVTELTGTNRFTDAIELFNYWYENSLVECDDNLKSDFLGVLNGYWDINVPILICINDENPEEILIKFGCTKYNSSEELGHLTLRASKWYIENVFVNLVDKIYCYA